MERTKSAESVLDDIATELDSLVDDPRACVDAIRQHVAEYLKGGA